MKTRAIVALCLILASAPALACTVQDIVPSGPAIEYSSATCGYVYVLSPPHIDATLTNPATRAVLPMRRYRTLVPNGTLTIIAGGVPHTETGYFFDDAIFMQEEQVYAADFEH